MLDIMLDLETMGTRPSSPICAIGAVAMDLTKFEVGKTFYRVVDLASNPSTPDVGTILWWLNQGAEARAIFTPESQGVAVPLEKALGMFSSFVMTEGGGKPVRVWGNGANFDNVILAEAYRALGMRAPWTYVNDRCYRTMKNMFPDVALVREGLHHNALDDATYQAKHLLEIMRRVCDVSN